MLETISFVDLVALSRITPDATVERFGGLINSSFFDASNILGTLKQKGLVDFITSFPSQSSLTVTELGKQLLDEASKKAAEPVDTLDMAVLIEISNGKRSLADLAGGVNVTPKDLALHLYKLSQQQYFSYELRNGTMNMSLTEKGFLQVKEGMKPEMPATQAVPGADQQIVPPSGPIPPTPAVQPTVPKTEQELKEMDAKLASQSKRMKAFTIYLVIVIVVVVIGIAYLYMTHAI